MKIISVILVASIALMGCRSYAQKPAAIPEGPTFEQRVRTDVWSGPGDPPAWAYRYLKLMDEYNDVTSQSAYCLRRRTRIDPSPSKGGVLGGIRICVSSEYPKVGERLEVQLHFGTLFAGERVPKAGDRVELMYELTTSGGVVIGVLPELPNHQFKDRENVVIKFPVDITNEDFQLLTLNVCGYVNGVLRDWDWDAVGLNHKIPGYEKLGRSERREIYELRKQAAVSIFDEDGHLVKD
jgi:hypothetical protein